MSKEYLPEVKVSLIVDNSASMEDEQALLAKNAKTLADAVRGNNVEFRLFTTSALDGSTDSEKRTHTPETLFEWFAPDGVSSFFPNAPGVIQGAQYPAYMVRTVNRLAQSLGGTSIVFRHDMSDSEFERRRDELYHAIVEVGTGGADDEAGLCAMGRILAENSPSSRFLSPGDKAAFLVISDANDFSSDEQCTFESQRQRFKFASTPSSPVVSTVEDSTNPQWWVYQAQFKAQDTHTATYSYEKGADFRAKVTYEEFQTVAVFNNPAYSVYTRFENPVFTLQSAFERQDPRVSYTYEYQSLCPGRDSSMVPCTKSESVTHLSVPNAAQGPASGGCAGSVLTFVESRLQSGQSLKTCSYSTNPSTSFASRVFSPSGYGFPPTGSGNLSCNAELVDLAKTLVPSGWSYSGCSYTYVQNAGVTSALRFNPTDYGSPAAGSGNLSCSAALENLARTRVPSGANYLGCYYTYSENRGNTSALAFDPSKYGNPPAGDGNLPCNAELEALARSRVGTNQYLSCYYVRRNLEKSAVFNPAAYGNPAPSTSPAPCNSELDAWALTQVPSTSKPKACTYSSAVSVASATLALKSVPSLTSGANCLGDPGVLGEVQAAQPGKVIRSCSYQKTVGAVRGTCTVEDRMNLARNLCDGEALSLMGGTHLNLEAFFRSNPSLCTGGVQAQSVFAGCSSRRGFREDVKAVPNVETYSPDGGSQKLSVVSQLMQGLQSQGTQTFQGAIDSKARSLFGDRGFFLSAILAHAEVGGCTPSIDSSGVGGEKYLQLVKSRPSDLRAVHPICDNSYSPALEGINQFVQRTALTGYRASIQDDEQITEVKIQRGQDTITLVAGTDYTVLGPQIDFTLDVVKPGDKILVSAERRIWVQNGKEVKEPKKPESKKSN